MRPKVDERPSRVFRGTRRYTLAARKLGLRIRALRKARSWTLEKASEQIGLEFSHIQQIEAGKINVTLATLLRVAEGFGAPIAALFAPDDDGEQGSGNAGMDGRGPRGSIATRRQDTHSQVGMLANSAAGAPEDPLAVIAHVGGAIRAARKASSLSLQQVAERLQVSVKYLQRVESGRANLTIASLVRISNALGMRLEELVGGHR